MGREARRDHSPLVQRAQVIDDVALLSGRVDLHRGTTGRLFDIDDFHIRFVLLLRWASRT